MSGGGAALEYYPSNKLSWNGDVAANKWWLLISSDIEGAMEEAHVPFTNGAYTLKFGGYNGAADYFVKSELTITDGQVSAYTLSKI
jgi:hypothetical protein